MEKKEQKELTEASEEASINTEELKDNFLKQGKWLRLLWMIGFSTIYYLSMTVLWIIVLVQFLFVLFTDKRSTNIAKVSIGFRNYMIQILDYLNYHSGHKPFPFNEFPKSED
tara:strand:- start:870 stop:1205 length:336 start_codon:yes stop_codon:yes gene_type:complete